MIDDDTELSEAMRPVLAKYGIDLCSASTPEEGLRMLRQDMPDVLVLDMMLPGMDGMMVCREIRLSNEPWRDVPIVALSARAELTDRVVGLESGIDDYIAKPVEPRELIARLRAVSRGNRPISASERRPQPQPALGLDEARLEASFEGVKVQVTELEFQVLSVLKAGRGKVLSRANIQQRLGLSPQSDPSMIDTIVYRIRQKFRAEGVMRDFIQTVRGSGYCITGSATA